MRTGFSIEYLADYPKAVDACAAWDFGHWDVRKKGATLEKSYKIFAGALQKEALPLTIVAMSDETKLPVAMASLCAKNGDDWPTLSPWISSVYVHYLFRGKGIARALVERLEMDARRLGYDEVYLQTDVAAGMYRKFGYSEIDRVKSRFTIDGICVLMKKDLV